MPNYRRVWVPGGTYFFTVSLSDRRASLLVDRIEDVRAAFRSVRAVRPFDVVAMVVMPDHLHCIWRMPEGDADYAIRWCHIKAAFTRQLRDVRPLRRNARRERNVWQRGYWERPMRDEHDVHAHIDYIHFNPVKHGYVERVVDWPHSTFHRYAHDAMLPPGWGTATLTS